MDDIQFSDRGWEDFSYWMDADRKTMNRIMRLIADIRRNGYQGIGKPEPLSGNLSGYWSRRIDEQNRIVYRLEGTTVKIIQCGSHYREK